MTREPDPEYGRDFPPDTPAFAAKKRRGEWQGAIAGSGGGAIILADSLYVAWTKGLDAEITGGPRSNHDHYPWWVWSGLGLSLLVLCLWWMTRIGRDRH